MNREKMQRRQSLKVVISEIIMVLTVVATVVILAFIVSGYWINSNFEVERQGMLQISSFPTGANVEIDSEESWFQRTNTSKILSSGEHTIKLSKENYDSWSKTVNISEGLLYRIYYPRLFFNDRTLEKTVETSGATFATASPDRNTLVLGNETTNWKVVNLDNDELRLKDLDISTYFPGTSTAEDAKVGVFSGKVLSADWSNDNGHILFKVGYDEIVEWVLIDLGNTENSANLTREFGADFESVKIFDSSANNFLAIRNHNLHKIDLPNKQISAILVENIINFDHYHNDIAFVAKENNNLYYVGLTKFNNNKIEKLLESPSPNVKVVISKFYDEEYVTILNSNLVSLYKKDNFEEVKNFALNFTPETIKVGYEGNFITMTSGAEIATLDMEAMIVSEWKVDGENFGWIDNNMIYSVNEGELFVYDFDGLNRRSLAKNVSNRFPVLITADKWLYYFSDESLMREWLIEK